MKGINDAQSERPEQKKKQEKYTRNGIWPTENIRIVWSAVEVVKEAHTQTCRQHSERTKEEDGTKNH